MKFDRPIQHNVRVFLSFLFLGVGILLSATRETSESDVASISDYIHEKHPFSKLYTANKRGLVVFPKEIEKDLKQFYVYLACKPNVLDSEEIELFELNIFGANLGMEKLEGITKTSPTVTRIISKNPNLNYNTNIYYSLKDSKRAQDWIPILLRIDLDNLIYDLFLEHRLWMANLPLEEDKIFEASMNIKGGIKSEVTDMVVGYNPYFEDADKDGLPDNFEIRIAGDPLTLNRADFIDDCGVTALELYVNLRGDIQ